MEARPWQVCIPLKAASYVVSHNGRTLSSYFVDQGAEPVTPLIGSQAQYSVA